MIPSAGFMCRAAEVQPRLRDKLSREDHSGSVLWSSLRGVIIVAAVDERQPRSGRSRQPAVTADHPNRPMNDHSREDNLPTHLEEHQDDLRRHLNRPFHAGGAKRVVVFYTPRKQGLCRRTHRAGATCQNRNLYSLPPQIRGYREPQAEVWQ